MKKQIYSIQQKYQATQMFEELKAHLAVFQESRRNRTSIDLVGPIIQNLKNLTYFRNQMDLYGADILQLYIPLLEPYFIRDGAEFIDNSESYVIVEGMIKGIKENGNPNSVFSEGMLVTINKDRNSQSYFSSGDTRMLKIYRSGISKTNIGKSIGMLSKMEKDRMGKFREIQKMINVDPVLSSYKEMLQKHSFFCNIGTYDLNILISQSKIQKFPKNSVIHTMGSEVTKLKFVLDGKIKIDHSVSPGQMHEIERGKMVLQKYMIHKRNKNKSTVASVINSGEWLGLEEYLWNTEYTSKGEVVSHFAEILLVPIQTFQAVFRELTHYNLMAKIRGLIETKKFLMEKTIKTKKEKEQQILFDIIRKQTLEKLSARVNKKQNEIERKDEHICKRSHQTNINSADNKSGKKSNAFSLQKPYPRQCYMPEQLVHKIQVYEQKYETLPMISERISLFPEEYEKAWVPLQFRDRILEMEKVRGGKDRKKPNRSFNLMNPEKIHERIIFDTLSPKETMNSTSLQSSRKKLEQKKSIESFYRMDSKEGQQFHKSHYNNSICNNFRAPKIKDHRLMKNISKTLDII